METPKVKCECVLCCEGDHPGECRECAGWSDRITVDGIVECEYCDGTGMCPKCSGANLPPREEPTCST